MPESWGGGSTYISRMDGTKVRELSCGLLSRALLLAALKTTFQHTGISAPLHDASLKMGTAKPKPKLRGPGGGSHSVQALATLARLLFPAHWFCQNTPLGRASSSSCSPPRNRKQVHAACASPPVVLPESRAGSPDCLSIQTERERSLLGPAPVSSD